MTRSATFGVLVMLCGSVLAFGAGTTATESEPAAEPMAASGEFNEAPMLAAMVAAGDLPPLPDRLPEEPAVLWPFAVDNPEIGKYGGTIQVFAVDNNPWGDLLEETERGSYIFRTNEDGEILPDLIRDYEVSDDETVFTLHLRKGMKWSDGAPFVADDFVFMWKDMALNEEVKSWFNNDEPLERIVKVDDYTLRYEFKVPYPTFVLNAVSWRGGDWMRFAPKHYLEKWHIEYNEDANELAKSEGFENWWEAFNHHWQVAPSNDIDKPMVQPWIFEEFTSTYRTFVRNPYYYAVDRAGNQLAVHRPGRLLDRRSGGLQPEDHERRSRSRLHEYVVPELSAVQGERGAGRLPGRADTGDDRGGGRLPSQSEPLRPGAA